ncbi:MAG TPA: MlaD family protein [Planctomycetota bacterium]|nr:MlaD family protein [Planctomycetota bacterium]
MPSTPLPVAVVRQRSRWSWIWLLPPLALGLAVVLSYRAWMSRGPSVDIAFTEGSGLKAGDPVRYRGIDVGQVSSVRLRDDGSGVRVQITLSEDARACTYGGTLFWVVRPQVGINAIRGLDTLIGSRYVAVLPGSGTPQPTFIGLDEPPVPEALTPGALDLSMQAENRGSLKPGAPVLYRQIQVGSVVSVGLASDASAIEARVRVRPEYARLVRTGTKFWDAGGLRIDAGITGITVRMSSLEALAGGGIAFATPPDAGPAVMTGHRFTLHGEADDEWLTWKPSLALEPDATARELALPRPLRATLAWDEDRWLWDRAERRTGWVLVVTGGLIAPAELVTAPDDAKKKTLALEVAGARYPLTTPPTWNRDGIAFLPISPEVTPWPSERMRVAMTPEDLVLVADPSDQPLPVSAPRLTLDNDGRWAIDASFSFAASWHGAAAVASADGKLVGVLLVRDGQGVIAPWR